MTSEEKFVRFKDPYSVDMTDFMREHPMCNSIVYRLDPDKKEINIVCYASKPEYNHDLVELFDSEYSEDDDYGILAGGTSYGGSIWSVSEE